MNTPHFLFRVNVLVDALTVTTHAAAHAQLESIMLLACALHVFKDHIL
jgi:hypothetical protein